MDSGVVLPRRGGSTVLVSIVTSALTTTALFFGLRALVPGGGGGGGAKVEDGDMIEVPNIVGARADQARGMLDPKGLILTLEDERDDPIVPAGAIAAQTPLAGSRAKKGSEIRAIMSRGAGQPKVPEVVGLPLEQALAKVVEAKLTAGAQTQQTSPTVPKGSVISTAPPAGTLVAPGTAVALVVSAGGETDVPKVTGMGISRAKKLIEEAGFVVGSSRYQYNEDYGGNIVLRQDPAAGSKAAPGSKIDLVVNEPD